MASQPHEALRIVLFIRDPMRTLYADLQQIIGQLGHRLVGVLTSAGPRTRRTFGYRDIVAQTPPSTDVIVSNFPSRWAGMLAPLRPDLILIMGWSWKLPDEVVALPRLGTINWHGALLPKYRGRGDWALQWMFRNDEPNYGITFHWVDSDWDTGPILAQTAIPIGDDDDMVSIFGRGVEVSREMLPDVIAKAARGEPGTPQPEGGFYCGPIEPEWREINWNAPARAVHNQVRSWLGQGAFATLGGSRLRVIKTQLMPGGSVEGAPGTVLARDETSLTVQCADGPLRIISYDADN